MKRIDTGRAANAYGGPAGGTGHWQDTDLTGGTQFDAEWCEGVQEALCGAIEGLGGVLAGDETGQLWGLLSPRVDGILSDAADTGVDTTTHKRVLIASSNSQASGVHTAVIASDGTSATTLDAAAVACQDSTVRREAVLLASRNAQLYDAKRIGWGYNTGAAIVPGVVNQNLTGIIDTETGALHIAGDLKIGGDPDDGSGSVITLNGTTGKATVTGGIRTEEGTDTAVWDVGGYWTATVNAVGGKVTIPFSATHPVVASFAVGSRLLLTNSCIQATSRVYCSAASATYFPIQGDVNPGAGFADVYVWNPAATNIEGDVVLSFDVVNPA